MSLLSVDLINAAQLSRLLDVNPATSWSEADAAAALRHQLAVPLLPELAVVPGIDGAFIGRLLGRSAAPATFLGQLTAKPPVPEVLESIKLFARHVRGLEASPLSGRPATVLYYGAIAAALAHGGRRITSLSDAELRNGFCWARDQSGGEALKMLFFDALEQVADI